MTKFYDKYGNEIHEGDEVQHRDHCPGRFRAPFDTAGKDVHSALLTLVCRSDGSLPEHGPYAKPPGVSTTLDVIEYAPEGPTAPVDQREQAFAPGDLVLDGGRGGRCVDMTIADSEWIKKTTRRMEEAVASVMAPMPFGIVSQPCPKTDLVRPGHVIPYPRDQLTADETQAALAIESAARHLAKPTLAEFRRFVEHGLGGSAVKFCVDRCGALPDIKDMFLIRYEWPDGHKSAQCLIAGTDDGATYSYWDSRISAEIAEARRRIGDAALRGRR